MKIFSTSVAAIVLSLLSVVFLNSCKKDEIKKSFKADFKTFYRIAPTDPVPVAVNGANYIGFANFPGGGPGNATYIGNCKMYFNQLVYTDPKIPGAPPLGSVNAVLVDILNYPVTGAPLPLIQAGDFNGLIDANKKYHIPADIRDKIINQVIYDDKGNALFTSAIKGSGATFPISETLVGFNGKGIIVGGRGKFHGTRGEFDYHGQFNIANPNDAEYHLDGWICY